MKNLNAEIMLIIAVANETYKLALNIDEYVNINKVDLKIKTAVVNAAYMAKIKADTAVFVATFFLGIGVAPVDPKNVFNTAKENAEHAESIISFAYDLLIIHEHILASSNSYNNKLHEVFHLIYNNLYLAVYTLDIYDSIKYARAARNSRLSLMLKPIKYKIHHKKLIEPDSTLIYKHTSHVQRCKKTLNEVNIFVKFLGSIPIIGFLFK